MNEVTAQLGEAGSARSGGDDEVLASYTGVIAVYSTAFAALTALAARRRQGLPELVSTRDLVLVALATHKLSRLVSKERVTRPIRAPFTEVERTPRGRHEHGTGDGPRKAIGQLLTCPFCLSQWIATAFVFGLVLLPRPTRLVISLFAALAGADQLQYLHAIVERHAKG